MFEIPFNLGPYKRPEVTDPKLTSLKAGDTILVRAKVIDIQHNGVWVAGKTYDGGRTFPPVWFPLPEIYGPEKPEPVAPSEPAPPKLSEFERQILEECAGLRPASPWGAAVGETLEELRAGGLIDHRGEPTAAGLKFLEKK